jgi:hypothetical protein
MLSDYMVAAEQLGVPVQSVQAVTWYIWKYTDKSPSEMPSETIAKNIASEVADANKEEANLKEDISKLMRQKRGELLGRLGYKFVSKNYRLGSDSYIQPDDPQPKRSKKLINMANKNIEKGNPKHGDMLHDPPSVGISLPVKKKRKKSLFENNIPEGIESIKDYLDEFLSIPDEETLLKLFELEKINHKDFWFKQIKFSKPSKSAYVYNFKKEISDFGNLKPKYIIEIDESELSDPENIQDWFYDILNYDKLLDYFEEDFEQVENENFWQSPSPLYHGTSSQESLDSILENGLEGRAETRGLTNRSVGAAVFTSLEPELVEAYTGSDGGVVVIDTEQMKQDGFTPFVGPEPEILEKQIAGAFAHKIGVDYKEDYSDSGMDPNTIIIYGDIPAKYIKKYEL